MAELAQATIETKCKFDAFWCHFKDRAKKYGLDLSMNEHAVVFAKSRLHQCPYF